MKRFLDYNKKLKERAAQMRKNMTKAEKKLWFDFLKDFSISKWQQDWEKIKVYRQRIIDHFIVDFYIPDYKLIIELDWESHYSGQAKAYDSERSSILEWLWCQIVRFTNNEVYDSFEWICERIRDTCENYNPHL